MSERWVGRAVRRLEDSRFVRGAGTFVDDVRMPGLLEAAVLRSPYAHARIVRIDARRALACPGVLAVVTGDDARRLTNPVGSPVDQYCLAVGKARHVGEAVAAVVATDRYAAEDGVDALDVEYEPLPPVTDPLKAIAPESPLVHERLGTNIAYHRVLEYGPVDRDFAEASRVYRERFRWNRHTGTPIETFGSIASFDVATGTVIFWSSIQTFHFGLPVAQALRLPLNKVRILPLDVGGSYGLKLVYKPLILTGLLSMIVGRPVKYIEDRFENLMNSDAHGEDRLYEVEFAVAAAGRIVSFKARVVDDQGAYFNLGPVLNFNPLSQIIGPYRISSVRMDITCVLTNKCQQAPYRGAGVPPTNFMLERMVDIIARDLGLDAAEIRFRNFIPPDQFPYTIPTGNVYDSGNYPAVLRKALDMVGYDRLRQEQREARGRGRHLGIGIASIQQRSVFSHVEFWLAWPEPPMKVSSTPESATIRFDAMGKVTVAVGFPSTGQGHDTIITQIVADQFGVPPEDITVVRLDSATASPNYGTGGSRMAVMLSGAIVGAAAKLKAKIATLAGHLLQHPPENFEVQDGRVSSRIDARKSLPLTEVGMVANLQALRLPPGMETGLEATFTCEHPYQTEPDAQNRAVFYPIMSHATHIAVVEVSLQSGVVRILRYAVAHDCGTVINPMIVEGQIHGGVAQGIGGALYEHLKYDDQGALTTASFMDYLVPTATEVPRIEVAHLATPSPYTALGVKGAGEGGRMAAPVVIANAIEDALQPFGIAIREVPITPDRLLAAIEAASCVGA